MDAMCVLVAARAATIERIAAVTADLAAVAEATSGSNIDDEHDPEGATVAFEREQTAAVRANARAHLVELDAAIARVEDGTYGTCTGCGRAIAPARLETLPATPVCVVCAARPQR